MLRDLGVRVLVAAGALISCAAVAAAEDWQAGAGPDWQKVLAAAKQEGSVVVAGPPQLAEPFAAGFLRDTGIQLEYFAGEARTTASRVVRELRAGNVTIDVFLTGNAELPQVKEGFFEDESARLLLPGVTDLKNWKDGKLKWVDNGKRFMLQTHEYVSAIPYYDSDAVKPEELTSWQDLLKPKFKGKIVVYDPRAGGPGVQMASYIAEHLGIEFLKSLYVGQEVVYSLDARQMVDWVARGVDLVSLGSSTTDYLTFRKAGVTNLAPAHLRDGPGALTGGFSVVELPRKSPHPNAATVFLNWVASQPGGAAFSRALAVPSRRVDVALGEVPEYIVPEPGADYPDQYTEDWFLNRRQALLKEVIAAIGGR
jgi:ABC-type Fe3+ transport system substrate-binding protein